MKYLVTAIRVLFLALFVFLIIRGKIMLWLGLYGLSLVLALIFGRIYCGYVCPMNTLMIPVDWLSKKLRIKTDKSPKWLKNGYFTWIALVVSVAAMLIGKKVLHTNIPVLPIWLGISLIVTIRFKPSVFHNLICPFGALQRVLGRFAIFSKRVEKSSCIGCSLCEKVCPSEAIKVNPENKSASIEKALCFQCNNCKDACPKGVIKYSAKSK